MILLALALAAGVPIAAAPEPGPVVRTDDGPVRGAALPGGGAVFRGIRFAAPPIGRLRWRPPARPRRWSRPVDTVAEHAACVQPVYGDWNRAASFRSSEDCLFLDVRTPGLTPSTGLTSGTGPAHPALPVLVWIHGGGNRGGAGGGTVESTITARGLVLVSIQYRLGALGFLSHPALSREQGGHSGNYALLDQQAALAWVQRNIARFGGDPRRVTIAGQSAGAQDVALLRLSPAARGLFAGAIQQSGTAGFGVAPRTLAQNERLGEAIATSAGVMQPATAVRLRALPVERIVAAQEAVDVPALDDDSFIWLQAVVDGRVLTDTPARLLARGRAARTPLLVGVNARELPLYGGAAAARPTIRRAFAAEADQALAVYGAAANRAVEPRLGDLATQVADDVTFRCPAVVAAQASARVGAPVWQYQFDHARAGADVGHGSETGYVFATPGPGEPPLQDYWVNFVTTGNPNGPALPRWPAYTTTARAYMAFDQHGPVVRTDLRGPLCRLRDAP